MGVRSLCGGLLIALAMVCTSIAQAQVSLAGFSASRGEGETIVQLDFTGSATFQLDRFTMGEWVSIWSNELALPAGVDEIPLEFDRPGLADYITGAAINDNGHRGSIKLYLAEGADRMGTRLEQDGNVLRVCIPDSTPAAISVSGVAPGSFTLPAKPEPFNAEQQPASATQEPVEIEFEAEAVTEAEVIADTPALIEASDPSNLEPVAVEIDAQSDESAIAPTSMDENETESTKESDAVDDVESVTPAESVEEAEETALETIPVQPISGSFAIPRDDIAPPVLPGFVNDAHQTDNTDADNTLVEPELMPSVRQAGPLSGQGEVNFQYLAPTGSGDKPAETDDNDNAGSDDLEQMLEEATEAAKQQLTESKPPAPGNKKGMRFGEPLSTPANKVINPYNGAAEMSSGTPDYSTPKTGKAALADITIDLFEILGTPLDQALTLLIAPTDYNVIIDASVGDNAVSLSFKNGRTDLKNALDLLTKTYGLDYAVQAGTIVIASKEKLYGQLIEFEKHLFVLNYADPQSVKDILINTGIVSENQVEIYKGETAYGEVNGSTELSSATGAGAEDIKKIETNLSTSPRNAVMIKAIPEEMVKIAEVINDIDRRPTMIELEVRVCEANENGMQNLGLEYNIDPVTDTGFVTQVWSEGENEDFSLGSMSRSSLSFIAQLNHEVQEGNVSILAQPTLVTMEDKQAIYFAGESIPYVSEVSRDTTGSTTFSLDYVKLGVTLNFKPRLDADGKITIDVNPEVSSLLEFIEFQSGLQAPRSQSRQLATTVRVSDCEPFVMAGLINETERETMRGIPILKDLPLVGKLFRNKNTQGERTEIIITVVPHVVNN